MARKRSKKKSTTRRKRRVGAVGGLNLGSALGIIGGAVMGRYVAKKLLPNVDEKIKNAGVVALGLFLPKFLKSDMGKALGNGMIAAGGVGLVGGFLPAIAGDEDMIEFPMTVGEVEDGISVIAGDDSVMAGDDDLSVLAGLDDDEY